MGKGSANRTKDRQRYGEEYDRIHKKPPVECNCSETLRRVGLTSPSCPVHACRYCDGTGQRFNGEKCDHRARRF